MGAGRVPAAGATIPLAQPGKGTQPGGRNRDQVLAAAPPHSHPGAHWPPSLMAPMMLGLLAALAVATAVGAPAAPATRRLVADGHFLKLQGPDTPTDDDCEEVLLAGIDHRSIRPSPATLSKAYLQNREIEKASVVRTRGNKNRREEDE